MPETHLNRDIPNFIVHARADKPAEQQIVTQLLEQHWLATDREKHLQQQRPQQFLRRNRRAPWREYSFEKSRDNSLKISLTIARTGRNG
jgi:hypothetical protein